MYLLNPGCYDWGLWAKFGTKPSGNKKDNILGALPMLELQTLNADKRHLAHCSIDASFSDHFKVIRRISDCRRTKHWHRVIFDWDALHLVYDGLSFWKFRWKYSVNFSTFWHLQDQDWILIFSGITRFLGLASSPYVTSTVSQSVSLSVRQSVRQGSHTSHH